jgi:hypothetical protein
MKLIEQICKLWWVEAGRDLTNPYSSESLQALELVLREDFDFSDDVVEYVMESIMRTPTHFKVGGDTDSGVDVDDDETAVSAILSRDELIAMAQHSEFLDEEEEEDDKQDAEDDIKQNSLTQYEKDRLEEIDASKMVSNPNPKGRKKMVTYGYAQQWMDDNPDAEVSDEFKKDTGDDSVEFKPESGKLPDGDDPLGDGVIKQEGLDKGYNLIKDKDGRVVFKPAPGNAGSMYNEIMSGAGADILRDNSDITDEELAEALGKMGEGTTLGKQQGSKFKKNNLTAAKAARKKFEKTQRGIKTNNLTEPIKTREFYGHKESIDAQVKLIENTKGPFYTATGDEIPKEDLVDMVKNSGGGKNPSDTASISVDKDGKTVVAFHSDKMSTADIQANSTPNQEYENQKKYINNTNLSDSDKKKANEIIDRNQKQLEDIENKLKSAANTPAKELSDGDISSILDNVKSDTNKDGTPNKNKTSTKLNGSIGKQGKTHKNIQKYLPDGVEPNDATEEQKMKAFLDYMGDDNRESEPTADQVKMMYRLADQQGYNITKTLGQIREESLNVQRDNLKQLNEQSISVGDKEMSLGDYIEGKNLIDKLHLDVIDGKDSKGVGKYDDLFELNMGGVTVNNKILKESMNVDNTADFINSLEIGTPSGKEDGFTRNKDGEITGENVFIYATTKGGKRIPVAVKTQRSKQGQSGKLSTTYQWTKQMQNLFKKNQ